MFDTTDLSRITLVYRDDSSNEYTQPLPDVAEVGILIDPETGDDMGLVKARVSPGLPIVVDVGQYQEIVDVIDTVKTDERSLDTDEYAGRILDALNTVESRPTVPPGIRLDAESVQDELNGASDAHNLTRKQADRIIRLSDEDIYRAILAEASSDFWTQYDEVRRRAIERLAHDPLVCIVQIDGDDYATAVDAANDHGGSIEAVVDYLADWDYGDETDGAARINGRTDLSDLERRPHQLHEADHGGLHYWLQIDHGLRFYALYRRPLKR